MGIPSHSATSLLYFTTPVVFYLILLSIANALMFVLDIKNNENFADETRAECGIIPTTAKKLNHSQAGKINQRVYESYYAATDILTVRKSTAHSRMVIISTILRLLMQYLVQYYNVL